MKAWSFDSPGPEATLAIGAELGRSIGEVGLAIGLIGPLGAGKTVLVKGIAEGLGVDPRLVSSPTFVIAQQYPLLEGPRCLHHVDLYRLESEDELDGIGFDECLEPGAVLVAEWADRFEGVLGPSRIEVELQAVTRDEGYAGEDTESAATSPRRRGRARAFGPEAERVLADWARRVGRLEEDGSASGRGEARGLVLGLVLLAIIAGSRFAAVDPAVSCLHPRPWASDGLGLAHVVCDDERSHASAAFVWPAGAGVGGLLFGERIDLNEASPELLETLPGIGPVRARAIVSARREAPFRTLRDLERVPGIGPKTRARLEPWLRVSTRPSTGGSEHG